MLSKWNRNLQCLVNENTSEISKRKSLFVSYFLFVDLMLPGIIQAASQQVGLDEEFEKEQMCSVVLLGNR